MRHVEAGWNTLTPDEQAEVTERVAAVDTTVNARKTAALPFFAFLAQVETIAIEIPLRSLETASPELRPLLRRQLVDEVFHSTLFARIAHELALPNAQPPAPYPSAERLLERIRREADLAVSATLLNLVAEGWIENLFRHAATWGVADHVFETVLADEARHVHEATAYTQDLDSQAASAAVARLEEGLIEVLAEPEVGLAMHELAGRKAHADMARDMHRLHREHLADVGLAPSAAWTANEERTLQWMDGLDLMDEAEPLPSTPWRASAQRVWDTPRDPTMQGDVDLPVGRIPKKLLTPVMVAAIGRAWAAHPELNRVVAKGKIWQLPRINVGVRVLVRDTELATVVITDADKRSVRDIGRMIIDGVQQLEAIRGAQQDGNMEVRPYDGRVLALADPGVTSFSVAISNPGKFGLVRGGGAFSGDVAPSTDISIGQRRRLPVWRGIGYWPSWHVNFGCLQDHRVFDGREAGVAMQAALTQMSRRNIRAILRTKDTLPPDTLPGARMAAMAPKELRMLANVGIAKYVPVAIGAAGAAAGIGAATYFLLQQQAAAAAGAATGAAGAAAGAMGAHGCHGTTQAGEVCNGHADDSGYCHRHREDA